MQLNGADQKYIFITGDSFCSYRKDPNAHWPAALAQRLGLELQGNGYPGQGWWMSRLDLVNYSKTDKFDNTDLFVFCHTEIRRPLTSNSIWRHGFTDEHLEFYLKYINDPEVDIWAAEHWYNDINKLLHGKTVIHLYLNNQHPELYSQLRGKKVTPCLMDISHWCNGINNLMQNGYPNHFTPSMNLKLAEELANNLDRDLIELSQDSFVS